MSVVGIVKLTPSVVAALSRSSRNLSLCRRIDCSRSFLQVHHDSVHIKSKIYYSHRTFITSSSSFQHLRGFILRSFNRDQGNPVLSWLCLDDESSTYTGNHLPQFSSIRPHHLVSAAEKIQSHYEANLKDLEEKLTNVISSIKRGENDENSVQLEKLEEILQAIDRLEGPVRSLNQLTLLLWLVSGYYGDDDNDSDPEWKDTKEDVSSILQFRHYDYNEQSSQMLYEVLQKYCYHFHESTTIEKYNNKSNELLWAATHLKRCLKMTAAIHLQGVQYEALQKKLELLHEVQSRIGISVLDTGVIVSDSGPNNKVLSDIFNIVHIKSEQAKMLGYANYVDMVLESRVGNMNQIITLHEEIAEKILPVIIANNLFPTVRKAASAVALDSDKNSGDSVITLDGVLIALFHLSKDLFGLIIEEEKVNVDVWDEDVRIFHIYDDATFNATGHQGASSSISTTPSSNYCARPEKGNINSDGKSYLGSFYLDALDRPGKLQQPVLIPIVARGEESTKFLPAHPLVCLSINLKPPLWDDMPLEVSWEDAETIFHEFGHVLQTLLAKPTMGNVIGPQNMPFDVSEFVPKFMELWLYDQFTMKNIIRNSSPANNDTDDAEIATAIESLVRRRSRRKALQIVQDAYFGYLEINLFDGSLFSSSSLSNTDDEAGESLLIDLQKRISGLYFPPDITLNDFPANDENDISPLIQVILENTDRVSNGGNNHQHHVAMYRYLWSEVLSTSVFQFFQRQQNGNYVTTTAENETKEAKAKQVQRSLGQIFRQSFLDPGALVDVETSLEKFSAHATVSENVASAASSTSRMKTFSVESLIETYKFK